MQAVCEEVLPGAGANDHVTIGFAFLVSILPWNYMPQLRAIAEMHESHVQQRCDS